MNNNGDQEQDDIEVDVSSSLDYLDQDSKQDQYEDSKRPDRQQIIESDAKKYPPNNKSKQKSCEIENFVEGIYLYKPGIQLPNLFHMTNQQIKVIIASEYLTKNNAEIIKRNVYGTDSYTSKSDCVCIGVHTGFINLNTFQFKRYEGIQIYFKASLKNGLLSRATKNFNENALKPETYKFLTSLPKLQKLEKYAGNMHIPIGKKRSRSKAKNLGDLPPLPEAHLRSNINNEFAYKYCIFNIADKGYDKKEFMIKKLDSYVLYLETSQGEKYEIVKGIEGEYFQVYKLSKVKNSKKHDNYYFYQNKAPLEEEEIQVMEENLEWDEITWGNTYMKAKEVTIENLVSFKYYKKSK